MCTSSPPYAWQAVFFGVYLSPQPHRKARARRGLLCVSGMAQAAKGGAHWVGWGTEEMEQATSLSPILATLHFMVNKRPAATPAGKPRRLLAGLSTGPVPLPFLSGTLSRDTLLQDSDNTP